jgi:hypothetical protein
LFVDLFQVDVRLRVAAEATLELLPQRLGVLQHLAHVGPDVCIEPVQANRPVPANLRPAVAESIHAGAAVVRVRCLIVFGEPADPLAVPTIAAAAAHQQSLQQVSGALRLLAIVPAVLRQLLSHRREQVSADQSGD